MKIGFRKVQKITCNVRASKSIDEQWKNSKDVLFLSGFGNVGYKKVELQGCHG